MCPKCEQNRQLAEMLAVSPENGAEVWSGVIGRVKRWFNMTRAKQIMAAAGGVSGRWYTDIDVEEAWRGQVCTSVICETHLDHVDVSQPVILGLTPSDEYRGDGWWSSVMDGIHRCARAHRDGIPTLPAIQMSSYLTSAIEIPAEEAVLNELLVEILEGGGTMAVLDGNVIVRPNGRLRDAEPNDHPLRAKFCRQIHAGISVFRTKL